MPITADSDAFRRKRLHHDRMNFIHANYISNIPYVLFFLIGLSLTNVLCVASNYRLRALESHDSAYASCKITICLKLKKVGCTGAWKSCKFSGTKSKTRNAALKYWASLIYIFAYSQWRDSSWNTVHYAEQGPIVCSLPYVISFWALRKPAPGPRQISLSLCWWHQSLCHARIPVTYPFIYWVVFISIDIIYEKTIGRF